MSEITLLPDNQMFISIDELRGQNLSLYKINNLVSQGFLRKINKKYYQNLVYQGDEHDLYYAYAYVPIGVVCLMSAAVYYGLSTYTPEAIDIAIPRKSNVYTLPEWPQMKIHYFTDIRYELGSVRIIDGKNQFAIYDIEKSVIDIIYYRNKIGMEETKEILRTYMNKKTRNLNQLMRYAKALKCEEITRNYLEMLI